MGEVLSGCAVRAAIQREGDKYMKFEGQEIANCHVCGNVPSVDKLPEDGLRIGCTNTEPDPHKCVIESEPGTWAIQTWNALQSIGADRK